MKLQLHIRELRKQRGMTLAQLAEKCVISVPHLSLVERGKKKVNNHLLERFAEHLAVGPDQLISSEGHRDSQTDGLYSKISLLSPEAQAQVDAFVDALLLVQKGGK